MVGITVFSVLMVSGMIIGFLTFLRPKTSEIEKRTLTEFPEFSVYSFVEGDFTSGLSTWYADTYPMRDSLLSAGQNFKLLYGFKRNSVTNVANGDDIPDVPDLPTKPVPTETDAPEETTGAPETQAPETTADATNAPETKTPETLDPNELGKEGQDIAKMNPQEAGGVNVLNLVGYCVYGFNLNAANRYAEAVATAANALKGSNVKVYELLIPNNSGVMLDEATRKAWNLSDEAKVIRYYTSKTLELSPDVICVPVLDTLRSHNSEYLYFYTDHHWTALGAYYAYVELCKAMGVTANRLADYQTEVTKGFLGSYYNTNGLTQIGANPDTITSYVPLTTNEFVFYDAYLKTERTGKIIRNMSGFDSKYGYMGFIYGDNPYSIVRNPNVKNGKTAVLVKESFGNCFAPFLVDHYETLYIIDYRDYKESIPKLVKETCAADLIFVNNLEALSSASTMDVLYSLCK